jgi:hypothetical protein
MQITDEILFNISSGFTMRSHKAAEIIRIDQLLQAWWAGLPTEIRLEPSSLPPVCPPPHILTLK